VDLSGLQINLYAAEAPAQKVEAEGRVRFARFGKEGSEFVEQLFLAIEVLRSFLLRNAP
jgi:hypothetical protein